MSDVIEMTEGSGVQQLVIMSATIDVYAMEQSVDANLAFDALADRVRRKILSVIAEHDECSVGEIADRIDEVGRTTVSSHLRVLRTSGLVTERRQGRYRYYSVNASGPAVEALEFLRTVLQSSLRELKSEVEDTPAHDTHDRAG
jgi:ArsR family transcriptional regulator